MRRSGGERAEDLAQRLALTWVNVAEKTRAGQVVLGVAEEAFRRCAAVAEGEIGAEQRHAAPTLFDERAEALLAVFQFGLRSLALGDIAQKCGERLIVAASDTIDRHFDRKLFTVRTPAGRFQ